MNYSGITYPDVNNGTGCRVTLWISGCNHHCKGCHNVSTWDFNSGSRFDEETYQKLMEILRKPYIKGLTLSGGDPLCSYDEMLGLVKKIKSEAIGKDIWLFTGFTMDVIKNRMNEILKYVDVIVDGQYVEKLRDVTLAFRGSSNQTIWEKTADGEFVRSKLND